MRDDFLRLMAKTALLHPKRVIAVAVVLALASALYASLSLTMNANTDDLISADRPYMLAYRKFLDEFGDLEPIICVIAPKEGVSSKETDNCITSLINLLHDVEGIEEVNYGIWGEEQRLISFAAMSDEELQGMSWAAPSIAKLRNRVGPKELLRFGTAQLERLPRTILPSKQLERGAAGIFALQAVASVVPGTVSAKEMGALSLPLPFQYLKSETGRLYFLEIMPAKDYGTLAVIEKPLKLIRSILEDRRRSYPNIEMGITGKPVLQADEMATTDNDMTKSSIVAIVLVALLFMAVIGGIRRPLLAVAALLIAIAWTFGLTTLVVGQLNLLSVVFTLILVGIGIDFGVHIVARFKEERAQKPIAEALEIALVTSGKGNVTGAVTSSLAFFMALLTDFRGLQELGFIGGTGLLLCLISMMIVLPALLVLFDQQPQDTLQTAVKNAPNKKMHRWAPVLLLLLALGTLSLLPQARDLGFNGNVLELQATGLDSIKWEHRILEDSSAATWFGASVVDSMAEVEEVVKRAKGEEAIGGVVSVLDFIQPETPLRRRCYQRILAANAEVTPETKVDNDWGSADLIKAAKAVYRLTGLARAANSDEVGRLEDLTTALRRLAKTMEDTKKSQDAKETLALSLSRYADALWPMVAGLQALDTDLRTILPQSMKHRLMSTNGKFLVAMHPKEDVWDVPAMERYVAAMRRVDPHVTGVPITHLMSIGDMKMGFGKAALYALIAVVFLVFLDFKNLGASLLAILPLLIGAVWLAITMGLFGLDFNLANFFAVPILIGLGVDNGIHLVHRWRESPREALHFGSTQKGILLTSLTSMVGFGCLAFATHRGLMSLGLVMALGCAMSLIASLVVLPLLLAWRQKP